MRAQGGGRAAERYRLGRADRREALWETEVRWTFRVRCTVGSSLGEGPVSLQENAKCTEGKKDPQVGGQSPSRGRGARRESVFRSRGLGQAEGGGETHNKL